MPTLASIESLCLSFADVRGLLCAEVTDLNTEIEALKRKHLPHIKRLVAKAAERHAALKAGIEAAPELFEKPRTVVFHGIKVGYQKGKGGIEFDDADTVVERIEKLFGDEATEYLHIEKLPDRTALARLTVAELKKLGCAVVDAADAIVIKPTDTAVDKIVNALLKDATADTEQAA